jgi:hypothetical protein
MKVGITFSLLNNTAVYSRAAAVKTSKYRSERMPADGMIAARTGSSASPLGS